MPEYFHEREFLNGAAARHTVVSGNTKTEYTFDLALYFSPLVDVTSPKGNDFAATIGDLTIDTGADEIVWNYGINTKRTPTYGGEVVQILSMFADKMIIKGTCRNYGEQRRIYEYFKKYIGYTTGSSGLERQQKYLVFKYPARRWSFIIMVTQAEGMRMATEQSAPEWQITAEIVSENDRYELGEKRTDRYADVLYVPVANAVTTEIKTTSPSQKGASQNFKLLKDRDPFGDLMGYMNGDRGKVAENFDAMIASWVTGDISTVRNNPIADPVKSADEIYKEHFGSDIAIGAGDAGTGGSGSGSGGGTTGGGTSTSTLSGTLEPVFIAALAANAFKQIGREDLSTDKGVLIDAVKVSYGESGWNTRSINYNGSGGQTDYNTYIAGDANKAPTSSSGGDAASYDLGLWQINNYWHPNEIRVACGENVSHTSPQAGSEDWKASLQKNIESGNLQKMLDDPLANAKAMAVIYDNNKNWKSWVAYGKSSYQSADAKAKAAVEKYLANPQQYDEQAVSGNVPNATPADVPVGDSIALAKKLLTYYREGKYKDDDGLQIEQMKKIANGEKLTNQGGGSYYMFDKVLKGIVFLIESGFTIGTYALMSDHHMNDGYHPLGQAVDISSINGVAIGNGGAQALNLTIQVARLLNGLGGEMFPDQIITFGVGGRGTPTNDILAGLCALKGAGSNGRLSASQAKEYYSESVEGHKDHIHVAWGPKRS